MLTALSFPVDNDYTVAYGGDWGPAVMNAMITDFQNDVVMPLWSTSGPRSYNAILPNVNGVNGDAFGATPFNLNNAETTAQLLGALKTEGSANFYWWGHGNSSAISATKLPQFGQTSILAGTVAQVLQNNVLWGGTAHPYRLVILDCCHAFSQAWAQAFGITTMPPVSESDLIDQELPLQAFVAWPCTVPRPPRGNPNGAVGAWGQAVDLLHVGGWRAIRYGKMWAPMSPT